MRLLIFLGSLLLFAVNLALWVHSGPGTSPWGLMLGILGVGLTGAAYVFGKRR